MKNLTIAFFALTLLIAGCKKSASDSSNPLQNGSHCRLLNAITTFKGDSTTTLFYYDSSGKLLVIKGVSSEGGDTAIGEQFQYNNTGLQYSFFHVANIVDTIFYFYNVHSGLDYTLEHNWTEQHVSTTKMNYFYNSGNQVTRTISKYTFDSLNSLIDSNLYEYTGNNITKVTDFSKNGNGNWTSITMILSYDNMNNFYKTMNMPPVSYYYWPENNITQIRYADSTTAFRTMTFSGYNAYGFPTTAIISNKILNETITENLNFEYQCE